MTSAIILLRPYSLWAFMLGSDYLRWRTSQFITPIPWILAAAFVGIAALLTMIAIHFVLRRDF